MSCIVETIFGQTNSKAFGSGAKIFSKVFESALFKQADHINTLALLVHAGVLDERFVGQQTSPCSRKRMEKFSNYLSFFQKWLSFMHEVLPSNNNWGTSSAHTATVLYSFAVTKVVIFYEHA
jgi:hypothetical protein